MKKRDKNQPTSSRKQSWWYALLAIPFLVYLKGLAPSVVLGDTGDFQTAGWLWGAAHQPGYPLYTIIVGIFERLPISPLFIQVDEYSTIAWRANFVSMIFAVLALMILFMLVNRLTGKPVAAMLSAGALAFSRVFWWHAEVCENDTLSALFILLAIYLAVRLVQDRDSRTPYYLTLVMGLAVSHHQSILLFFPAIFLYLGLNGLLKFDAKKWVVLVLVFILGLTPFIYLPLVKYKTPDGPLNFITETEYDRLVSENPDELLENRYSTKPPLNYFLDYIARGVYARQREYTHTEEALGSDVTTTSDVFQFYLALVLSDFGLLLSLAGVVGLFLGFKRWGNNGADNGNRIQRNNWILIFSCWILYFLVIQFYPSGDILRAPYYNLLTAGPGLMLPLQIVYSIFIGLGISSFLDWSGKSGAAKRKIELVTVILGIVLIAINFAENYKVGDKSRNTLAHEYGLNVLDSCDEDSVLVVAGDEIYAFYYLHYVHPDPETGLNGYRPDVKVSSWSQELERFSDLADISSAMAMAMAGVALENPGREINATFFNSSFYNEPALMPYTLARRGLNFVYVPQGDLSGFTNTESELAGQTGVEVYEPGLPENYRWKYWDCESVDLSVKPEPQFKWMWEPESDIQWRISEMLLFYGSDALIKGETGQAARYFYRMAMVEPEDPYVWEYLDAALTGREQ